MGRLEKGTVRKTCENRGCARRPGCPEPPRTGRHERRGRVAWDQRCGGGGQRGCNAHAAWRPAKAQSTSCNGPSKSNQLCRWARRGGRRPAAKWGKGGEAWGDASTSSSSSGSRGSLVAARGGTASSCRRKPKETQTGSGSRQCRVGENRRKSKQAQAAASVSQRKGVGGRRSAGRSRCLTSDGGQPVAGTAAAAWVMLEAAAKAAGWAGWASIGQRRSCSAHCRAVGR
jgi:hypothetical protein